MQTQSKPQDAQLSDQLRDAILALVGHACQVHLHAVQVLRPQASVGGIISIKAPQDLKVLIRCAVQLNKILECAGADGADPWQEC